MELRGSLAGAVARALFFYFELIDRVLLVGLRVKGDSSGFSISLEGISPPAGTIDERIAKIDIARENLAESLRAIDELKVAAEDNKKELQEALAKFQLLEKQKANAEIELQEIKRIAQADVETFRKLAGVPTEPEVRKERIIGFVSGVLASLFAAGLIYVGNYAWGYIGAQLP